MKQMKLFVLEGCPYCKKALGYLAEFKTQQKYQAISYELIEERQQANIAEQYDYYYVPCFYLDEVKVHEGAINKDQVQAILDQMLAE